MAQASPGRLARLGSRAERVLAGVGLLTVGGVAVQAAAARKRSSAALPAEGFVLELDLEQGSVVESARPRPLQTLLAGEGGRRKPLELAAVVDALQAAGDDTRVVGLLALLGGAAGLGLAQTQELCDAVSAFRTRSSARGAPSLAYADAFGEGGGSGTGTYLLASAFEFVAVQPTGLVSVTGLSATPFYARGFLDRFKVKPVFFAREEYKSAASFLLNHGSSKAEREALRATLASLSSQVVAGIAAGRGLTEKQVVAAIDSAPHLAVQAERLGLVDARLHRDQALKLVPRLVEARRAGPPPSAANSSSGQPAGLLPRLLADPDAEPERKVKRISVARYAAALDQQRQQREAEERWEAIKARVRAVAGRVLDVAGWPQLWAALRRGDDVAQGGKAADQQSSEAAGGGPAGSAAAAPQPMPRVALLTLEGPIFLGLAPSGPSPSPNPGAKVASLPVIRALQKAREDKAVKAVVLRVDSPGGSATASEAIHREVALLRRAGKTVVVSMGNAAASGGYYLATAADKIVAQPATVTGSIGVLAGKLVFDEAMRAYDIHTESYKAGRNADVLSPFSSFDRAQRAAVEALIDDVYATFKQRVAEGRGLSPEAVARLAKGRVWTGEQALALGLVDELGGLETALALAKKEAGLPMEEGAVLVKRLYPERRSPLATALKALSGDGDGESGEGEGGKDGAQPGAAPAAAAALVATTAALGLQLTAAEWALLAQGQGGTCAAAPRSLRAAVCTAGRQQRRLTVKASADAKFADYKPRTAFFFPGQGAQTVGMAVETAAQVPAAKALFECASDILGYDLLAVCAEGPKEKLDSTAVSQPAIYVASLAALEKLKAEQGDAAAAAADVAAGLSLGEYTALTYAGAIDFEDGVRLVKLRGESMQAAADATPSGMVSVIGLSSDKVAELCEAASKEVAAGQGVQIANFLCNGNYAVSGGIAGCEALEKLAKSFKARMTVRLAVAGAFHTDFMAPAREKLQAALEGTDIKEPRIPVISNVDAAPHADPAVIKAILAQQLTAPVQWETTLKALLERGLEKSYEIGPNKVIAGIMKRVDKAHPIENITV
ncbi:malonyl-acyl carrier mitochondrial [Micractinium conductrix]|uniref:Malonyl-acyl carrier mitochondrial n=1 Tax=Micractinium conductrix TaxID=554055 RepID=A0A2P6V057_9CHLO|nr:malonyl-acyl carrier mitochondrial [Micractinium conductrix]|eukprot:PSC67477.1 malonyl-acyl carrier mitochondrial [Micractinium conductrix]